MLENPKYILLHNEALKIDSVHASISSVLWKPSNLQKFNYNPFGLLNT